MASWYPYSTISMGSASFRGGPKPRRRLGGEPLMDLRPPWPTAACTLVFEEVWAWVAVVEALRLFPELTIAGMPVSPTGHCGHDVDDTIVRQRNVGTQDKHAG